MNYISFNPINSCRFESAGRFVSVNHPYHPRRKLRSAVLLLGYAGCYPIAQDGRRYQLEPGTFMFLFPEHEHYGTDPASDGQSHFWCHFQLPTYEITAEPGLLGSDYFLPEFGHLNHVEQYYILFNQLIDAASRTYQSPALRQSTCNAYVSILLNSICDEYCSVHNPAKGMPSRARMLLSEKVQQWIRLHYREPISSKSVAAALQYNSDYLTQVLKSTVGFTLSEVITEIRLTEAAKLLLNSDMRISEIAYAVGFRDVKYFMKAFKKAESVTPSEYRQAYYRMHINQK